MSRKRKQYVLYGKVSAMNLKISSALAIMLSAAAITSSAQDDIWQWMTEVRNTSENPKYQHPAAYLWIPDDCREVKALIVAQHNMEEISILEDPGFRKEMKKLGVAELWICPRYNLGFNFNDGAWEGLDQILDDLADKSGYTELVSVPLIGIGHSAAASAPYYMGASRRDRVLACISVSGQWPYYRDSNLCPDIWEDRTLDYIPCLETMGEYEAAESWAERGLEERRNHPLTPLSMLACPGEGHFAYSVEKARYIALFIRKALKYGHVDPTKEGWLAERWKRDEKPSCTPAPVGKYKGNPSEAFWYFDHEMAMATIRYQERFRGRKVQLAGVMQNGVEVPQRNTHMQLHPKLQTEEDGLTFNLRPFFYDTVSDGSPRHKSWSRMEPGSPIGHAEGEPYLEIIAAPAYVSGDTTLTLSMNRMATWEEKEIFIDFCIRHDGDKEYRPAVQQARITLPVRLTKGREQTISFAPLEDVVYGTSSMELEAYSDSGLKVGFYAECGPVRVEGNRLMFEKVPPRTKFPITVSVVAWQYGRTGNDPVRTAEPVRRTFLITKD